MHGAVERFFPNLHPPEPTPRRRPFRGTKAAPFPVPLGPLNPIGRVRRLMNPSRLTFIFPQDFTRTPLPLEEIYVPPHHQPINPEDEDDVVPDQHAAFGIQRATQAKREPAWKDLGLDELLKQGPITEGLPLGRLSGAKLGPGGRAVGSGSRMPR